MMNAMDGFPFFCDDVQQLNWIVYEQHFALILVLKDKERVYRVFDMSFLIAAFEFRAASKS